MTLITEQQKQIYNLHLRAFRLNNNQPFRAKKNFSDVEADESKMTSLQKIEKVFSQYPAFFNSMYFDAPYKIYDAPDSEYNAPQKIANNYKKYYPLKFYGSHKGITTCIAYYKTLIQSNPEEQFDFLKESYKFIANFCIEKNISLENYTKYCSVSQNDCLKHLKDHKISWYIVFSVPNFYELLYKLPLDEFELYYGSDMDLNAIFNRYNSSLKTQQYLNDIKGKISQYVQKKLANPTNL